MAGILLEFVNSFGLLGLILFALLWFVKEKIYYIPDISGIWNMELVYTKSDYNPYKNMKVKYKMFINQNNNFIAIKGEKYFEELNDSSTKEYEGNDKTFSEYDGYIKRGLMNHTLKLNIKENGKERIVTGQLNLKIISHYSLLQGLFNRQDANSRGIVVMTKVNE